MSTVIAFPVTGRAQPARRGAERKQTTEAEPRTDAQILILPVVRIERYEALLPGPVQRGAGTRRPH